MSTMVREPHRHSVQTRTPVVENDGAEQLTEDFEGDRSEYI